MLGKYKVQILVYLRLFFFYKDLESALASCVLDYSGLYLKHHVGYHRLNSHEPSKVKYLSHKHRRRCSKKLDGDSKYWRCVSTRFTIILQDQQRVELVRTLIAIDLEALCFSPLHTKRCGKSVSLLLAWNKR